MGEMNTESRDLSPSITAVTSGQSPNRDRPTPWHVLSHPGLPTTCHGVCERGEADFAGSFATVYNCDKSVAHLLSAAPDLLEALRSAEAFIRDRSGGGETAFRETVLLPAIAKAEGR
jgi:hypothetical protein